MDGEVELLSCDSIFGWDYLDEIALLGDNGLAVQHLSDRLGWCGILIPYSCRTFKVPDTSSRPRAPLPAFALRDEHLVVFSNFEYLGNLTTSDVDVWVENTPGITIVAIAFANSWHPLGLHDIRHSLKEMMSSAKVARNIFFAMRMTSYFWRSAFDVSEGLVEPRWNTGWTIMRLIAASWVQTIVLWLR